MNQLHREVLVVVVEVDGSKRPHPHPCPPEHRYDDVRQDGVVDVEVFHYPLGSFGCECGPTRLLVVTDGREQNLVSESLGYSVYRRTVTEEDPKRRELSLKRYRLQVVSFSLVDPVAV